MSQPLAAQEYLLLAYWWVRRLGYRCRVSREDREQTGIVGLLESLKTYDPNKGSLSLWSAYYIKTELSKQNRKFRRVVAYPVKGSFPKRALRERWEKGEISDAELVSETRIKIRSPEHIGRLIGLVEGHDTCDTGLAETLDDPDALERIEWTDPYIIERARVVVTEREFDIVSRHLFGEEYLADIGGSYGISRERVRQIYERALRKMREALQ